MINLPNITLTLIDGTGKDTSDLLNVIDICTNAIVFGEIVLITADTSIKPQSKITVQIIEKMSYAEYNSFCILKLSKFINTDYCLIVQTDGFISNPHNFDHQFFDYDYIGAPWVDEGGGNNFNWIPEPKTRHLVGCGGFCLRSKKLLELGSKINSTLIANMTQQGMGEDAIICIYLKEYFENHGCKFPSWDFAKKFALGSTNINHLKKEDLENTFGFHSNDYKPLVTEIRKQWYVKN